MGAYIMPHPRVKVLVLATKWFPLYLPAYPVSALWFLFQLVSVWLGGGGLAAWWARIGGFVAGAILVVPFRDKRAPLFDAVVPQGDRTLGFRAAGQTPSTKIISASDASVRYLTIF